MIRSRTLLGAVALVLGTLGAVAPVGVHAQSGDDPGRSLQWGLDKVHAPAAWSTGRGDRATIAILDTGVDLHHEDLEAKIVPGRDFVDDDADPSDVNGHGTHVAGIAAAVTDNGKGVAGTAPGARIMPVRVLDEDGDGFANDVLAGVRWAVDNGADVINLSISVTGAQLIGTSLNDAVRYAWEHGAIPVVAAGNDYVLSSGFADEPAIVVAATTRDDTKPEYSNGVGSARWGMAAPGGGSNGLLSHEDDDILSTWWNGDEPNLYAYQSGTSMAAPHVSGAAAVLLDLGLTPRQVVDRLIRTARDIGPTGFDSTFGHGLLDLEAAVAGLGQPAPTSTPSTAPATEPSRTGSGSSATTPGSTSERSTTSRAPSGGDGDAPDRSPLIGAGTGAEPATASPRELAGAHSTGDEPPAGLIWAAVVALAGATGGALAASRAGRFRPR